MASASGWGGGGPDGRTGPSGPSGPGGSPRTAASSRDNSDYEDYWHEIKDIVEDEGKEAEENRDDDDPGSKTPDEGEQEAAWLTDAGYAHLVSKYEEGRLLEDDTVTKETASLTRTQAAAVKRRVETLNATLRQRNRTKLKHKVDVRDLFDQTSDTNGSTESSSNGKDSRSGLLRPGKKLSRRADGSFLKRTGGYSLSSNSLDETDSQDVETISIQSKGAAVSRTGHAPGGLQPPTPPTDIELNRSFSLEAATDTSNRPATKDALDSNTLPKFILQKDPLGVTRVADLTPSDMERVRALSLIELTALFDTNDIVHIRHKQKKRYKDHGIFGVPLQTLLDHDLKKHPCLTVPKIVFELTCFLEKTGLQEEGILRVPGSQTRMKTLRSELDSKFNKGEFDWNDLMPNDAAGLLKMFVRELPVPLLTFEYLDAFAQVENVPDITQKVQALNHLVLVLPDVHRNTLQVLLKFLKKVVDMENNKMNLNNVSMIMAPNLFLVAKKRKKTNLQDIELRMAAGTSNIVRMLIKYQDILWTIPSFTIAQIRQKYEADHLRKYREKSTDHVYVPKGIMKLLGRKDKADTYRKPAIHQETDYQEGVIRVLCPHTHKKHQTPIQLDASTTANDVINKFRRWTVALPTTDQADTNGRHSYSGGSATPSSQSGLPTDKLFLFENGGNIGERRLDPSTQMLALLRVNPNAEWSIKVSHLPV